MKATERLTEMFREHGLRVTPQRQALFGLLQGNQAHPTVDSLYDAARRSMPTISRRTVYQTVHDLESMGEISLLDLGTGSLRVDPNVEVEHHHLVCRNCGKVRDVPATGPSPRLTRHDKAGFAVASVDVIFRGTCEACSTAG
jgi:Fe2+ or Zn2+ uptake regulation protein